MPGPALAAPSATQDQPTVTPALAKLQVPVIPRNELRPERDTPTKTLIAQLVDPQYLQREGATRELAFRPSAFPEVLAAWNRPELPEQKYRAEQVLNIQAATLMKHSAKLLESSEWTVEHEIADFIGLVLVNKFEQALEERDPAKVNALAGSIGQFETSVKETKAFAENLIRLGLNLRSPGEALSPRDAFKWEVTRLESQALVAAKDVLDAHLRRLVYPDKHPVDYERAAQAFEILQNRGDGLPGRFDTATNFLAAVRFEESFDYPAPSRAERRDAVETSRKVLEESYGQALGERDSGSIEATWRNAAAVEDYCRIHTVQYPGELEPLVSDMTKALDKLDWDGFLKLLKEYRKHDPLPVVEAA